MTYQTTGVVRDYSAATDTATVELNTLGIVDTWLDGVKIDAPVSRAYMTNGQLVTVALPDAHRLCEAHIVAVPGAPLGAVTGSGSSQKTETGCIQSFTNNSGAATLSITFPVAFTAAPTVQAGADAGTVAVSAITTTGFSAGVSGAPANAYVWTTWTATGT